MRNNKKVRPSLTMATLSATILMALTASAYAVPSKTAQGTYVQFTAPTELAIEQNTQYRLDDSIAASYFSNNWDGIAAVATCNGSTATCSTTPVAPAMPAPLASKADDAVRANRCIFLNGGNLSGSTYTQSVQSITKGWTYTWTYSVTPVQNPIEPKTAWVVDRILGGADAADVDVDAMIAGESVVMSSQFPPPGKYSFSLLDSAGFNRVQDLKYTVTDTDSHAVVMTVPGADGVALVHGAVAGVDLEIQNYNGGTNGVSSLLWGMGGTDKNKQPQTLPQHMSFILNNDAASNNDNGGAGGLAMSVDQLQRVTFSLIQGNYAITLSGMVKGNSVTADQPFSLTKSTRITYVGSGCGQ